MDPPFSANNFWTCCCCYWTDGRTDKSTRETLTEKSENNIFPSAVAVAGKVVALWKFIDRGFQYFSRSIKSTSRHPKPKRRAHFWGKDERSRPLLVRSEKQIARGNIFAPPHRERRRRWRRHRAINSQSRKTINYSDICFKTVTGRVEWTTADGRGRTNSGGGGPV